MRRWLLLVGLAVAAGLVWCLPGRHPNVLLITVGGLRADAISAQATPHIEALAASGVTFSQAVTDVPWTRASIASVLTGRTPLTHRVRSPIDPLPASLPVLAERFRSGGYRTAAIVSDFDLDAVFGLDRGFERFDDHFTLPINGDDETPPHLSSLYFGEAGQDRAFRRAKLQLDSRRSDADTTDAAIGYLQRVGRPPFLLWVHYFAASRVWGEASTAADQVRRYPQSVQKFDEELGRLLSAVTALDLHRDTVIVLLGDHGQSLLEHGSIATAQSLYEPSVRIPLIVSWWGHLAYGRSVDALVSVLDVAPTLFNLSGIAGMHGDGSSLVGLMQGDKRAGDDGVYLETYLPATLGASRDLALADGSTMRAGFALFGLRTQNWKLLRKQPHGLIDVGAPASLAAAMRQPGTTEELYDLAADPGETVNLISGQPDRAAVMRRRLDQLLAGSGGE